MATTKTEARRTGEFILSEANGTRSREEVTIAAAAGALDVGTLVGKITATFAAPMFPKYVLLIPQDSLAGLAIVLVICALASVIAIRMALRVDPAEAIGG